MNRMKITAAVSGLTLLAGGAWLYQRADAKEAPAYRYAAVERGTITASVSATGKLGAERAVQVGTQVSGQVAAIYVDFNDKVTKGQLLARIDPTLQQQAVQEAEAQVERAEAQLALAKGEYDRQKPLYDARYVTASDFAAVQSSYAVAQSTLKSARIALDKARQNLAYTSIHSPIDGIIVERNVDVGQTVAASLSAPQLFLIANDLSEMQILASVDESDIGSITEGQKATFTVQSYPNRTFTGTVKQVRLQSATTDNVVNYTAVVAVQNPDGRLLPGMTATVSFVTGEAANVLTVPNAALRIRPTEEMAAQAGSAPAAPAAARRDSSARRAGAAGARGGFATLWYVGTDGKLASTRVKGGVTDGTRTQVTGDGVNEGMQVMVSTGASATGVTGAASTSTASSNPLAPQRMQRGPGGPPPGGF